jgi:hypothetical protein
MVYVQISWLTIIFIFIIILIIINDTA